MREAVIGKNYLLTSEVTRDKLAVTVESGELEVFATPMMIAAMEKASSLCIKEFLEDGETTVGTYIEVSHTSATPLGMKIFVKSVITSVNGREIEFEVEASDEKGIIGKAKHKRFVVNSEKFQNKTNQKMQE